MNKRPKVVEELAIACVRFVSSADLDQIDAFNERMHKLSNELTRTALFTADAQLCMDIADACRYWMRELHTPRLDKAHYTAAEVSEIACRHAAVTLLGHVWLLVYERILREVEHATTAKPLD